MNRNTLLWIAAGVGIYLLLRKLNKASPASGIGQTVDWRSLPMPGMSMGSGQPWVDESIVPPEPTQWMRSGRLAGFDSVETIGQAEFGCSGLGCGSLGGGAMLPSLGANAGMSMGPIGSMLPRLQQPGVAEGTAGMSMGKIGPMLPSIATGTFDYRKGSLTDEEARQLSRTAGGFATVGPPGSGGAYRSGAMLPRLQQPGIPEGQVGMSLGPAPLLQRLAQSAAMRGQNVAAEQMAMQEFQRQVQQGQAALPELRARNPQLNFPDVGQQPQGEMSTSDIMAMEAGQAGQAAGRAMPAQGAPSFGSDSWGGDAGTSTDIIQVQRGQRGIQVAGGADVVKIARGQEAMVI